MILGAGFESPPQPKATDGLPDELRKKRPYTTTTFCAEPLKQDRFLEVRRYIRTDFRLAIRFGCDSNKRGASQAKALRFEFSDIPQEANRLDAKKRRSRRNPLFAEIVSSVAFFLER